MIKIPLHIAEKLLKLQQGETLPASSAKHPIMEDFFAENIIQKSGRVQKKLFIANTDSFIKYLQNKFGINNLQQYIEGLSDGNLSRSKSVEISGNSKLGSVRTFKGFLVNCYDPIRAKINGDEIIINPTIGTFQFIYDFETFEIPSDITIIGIENSENFRYIEKQKDLFCNIKALFVSRYPQNKSGDLRNWLQSIPNSYLHFGDFDFAGIAIYLNEYKKYLDDRANFYMPENIEQLIRKYGNKKLYDTQKTNFDRESITEQNLLTLISEIHKYKKGLEQEILIEIGKPSVNSVL